jgi:ribosomal-protein-alanine N-acetyltransferase
MPLPILKTDFATPETLLRYFHKTEFEWSRHVAEETLLDVGMAMRNAELPRTWIANRILDAQLAEGMTPADAVRLAHEHFAEQGLTCWQWVMNPSAAAENTAPLVEHLLANGHRIEAAEVMYLQHLPTEPIEVRARDLTIIPTRASFKHARRLFEEWASESWNTPELADAAMLHLDDPHYDALLALRDGAAAGHAGVLAIGEIGLIEQVFVTRSLRKQGIATALMSRALEVCARSLFKHVFLSVAPDNAIAGELYHRFGFRKIGKCVAYQKVA